IMRHGVIPLTTRPPGLLVVDEVHHLVARDSAASYAQLTRLAHAAPRLLLLSATPVMDDDDSTLRLFHLLDPATYPLEDSVAFANRMARRQEIGRLLLVLASGTDAFVMSRAVSIGRQSIPDDPTAQDMLDSLEVASDDDDEDALGRERARLREYL